MLAALRLVRRRWASTWSSPAAASAPPPTTSRRPSSATSAGARWCSTPRSRSGSRRSCCRCAHAGRTSTEETIRESNRKQAVIPAGRDGDRPGRHGAGAGRAAGPAGAGPDGRGAARAAARAAADVARRDRDRRPLPWRFGARRCTSSGCCGCTACPESEIATTLREAARVGCRPRADRGHDLRARRRARDRHALRAGRSARPTRRSPRSCASATPTRCTPMTAATSTIRWPRCCVAAGPARRRRRVLHRRAAARTPDRPSRGLGLPARRHRRLLERGQGAARGGACAS